MIEIYRKNNFEVEKIKSFSEFTVEKSVVKSADKKTVTVEGNAVHEDQQLNEGFLDAIVRFFKGIFDLFNDKEVKKEAEDSQKYFSQIENDENISDEEIEEEIDVKRVRRSSEKLTVTIVKRIETDKEKGIRTVKNLKESLSSWIGMILTQEEAVKMPLLSKMIQNPELVKRFTWVPAKYTKENMKDWFKDKDCVLDKSIETAIKGLANAPANKRKDAVTKFAENYITYVAKKTNSEEKFKSQDEETLDMIHLGFAKMASNIVNGMSSIIKNTQDDKLAEVVADEIITARKRKSSKKPGQKPEPKKADSEDETSSARSRKSSKSSKTATTKTTAKPKATTKTTTKKEA